MYAITYTLGRDEVLLQKSLRTLLAALTMVNAEYLRRHPEAPSLEESGVKYTEENACADDWQDIPTILKLGGGDCEDLACYRAAELQVRHGIQAWPFAKVSRNLSGGASFHTQVRHPDGRIEDPAKNLGLCSDCGHDHSCTGLGRGSAENRISFILDLFQGNRELELSQKVLQLLLGALTVINVRYLQAHPETPRLYSTPIRYNEEPPGREDWQDIPTNMARGEADCEDLACHRAAELIVRDGIRAWPMFAWKVRPSGAYLYHITVRYPDGSTEDPSKRLGM